MIDDHIQGNDELTGTAKANADVNDDGFIDTDDTNIVTDYLAGTIKSLPAAAESIKYEITLSDFEGAGIFEGKQFSDWSGNIKLKIAGRGESADTYTANVLVDEFGNQSMMETDDTGSWMDITIGNPTTNQNTEGIMFADFVKPEITYVYSETDINKTAKTATIVFSVVDKYFASSSLTEDDLTILIDGKTIDQDKITKEITETTDITATVDGVANTVIGKQYTLLLSDLEQVEIASGDKYLNYSGIVSVIINAGKVADKSGNTNDATTLTVGVDFPEESIETDSTIIMEADNSTPYLPEGYTYVEGDLSTGIVIEDSSGNQFVWVEVPKTATVYPTAGLDITNFTDTEYEKIENDLHTYTSVYRIDPDTSVETTYTDEYAEDSDGNSITGLTEIEYNMQKKKMLKSIYKNGGFYVGRYETGIEDSYRTQETVIAREKPVIKQNAYVYNYVTPVQAQELSEEFSTAGYTSSLMFGVQWDLIMKHLETEGLSQDEITGNSTEWGNYYVNLFNITNTSAKYSKDNGVTYENAPYDKTAEELLLLTTGAHEEFVKENIYDLAGNIWERTLEYSGLTNGKCVVRGEDYGNVNSVSDIVNVRSPSYPSQGKYYIGFRVSLYKDEGTGPDSDASVTMPYLPSGFSQVEGSNLDNGLVIEDNSGNQFVWVEVPRTTTVYPTAGLGITEFTTDEYTKIENDLHTYTSVYRNGTTWVDEHSGDDASTGLTSTQYTELKQKMLKSIYLNGGFYVGRYETGIGNTYRTESGDITGYTPVIQKDVYPYNYVTVAQSQELSSTFAPTGYTSNLIFGVQWDLVLKHMETKGAATQNQLNVESTALGNFADNLWSITTSNAKYTMADGSSTNYIATPYTKTAKSEVILTTGALPVFSQQNIYDMGGNMWEWTLESYTPGQAVHVIARGGCFGDSGFVGDLGPVSTRGANGNINASQGNAGFRVSLFVDGKAETSQEPVIVDVVDPIWQTENLTIDETNKQVTVDIVGTDKYFSTGTLTADSINVVIDGEDASIAKSLSGPIAITEDRDGDGTAETQYGVKYTLTLSGFEESAWQTGKNYLEWSSTTKIQIPANTLTDSNGNTSKAKEFELGLVDVINPEIRYQYSEADINKTDKEVTIQFSIRDEYYDAANSSLALSDLTIKVDNDDITNVSSVKKSFTSTDITAENDSSKVIGKTYTLVLSELEQDAIAEGKNYLDYSGIFTVAIPAGKIKDTSGNGNDAKTITMGVDIPEESEEITSPHETPYIPTGYSHVEGTDISTGYVVEDGSGNQYVWIEVPRTAEVYPTAGTEITSFTADDYTNIENDLHTYTSVYRIDPATGEETTLTDEYAEDSDGNSISGLTETEYNTEKKKMLKSIYKNGGFYIGRYETGLTEGFRDYLAEFNEGMEIQTTIEETPVIKANAYPYNWVTASQAQELSERFSTTGYRTNLMFGVQWDLMLKYLETKGVEQADLNEDSTELGNYYNNLWTLTNTSATGLNITFQVIGGGRRICSD